MGLTIGIGGSNSRRGSSGGSATIKGYFHEGGFYKDSAYTEPIEGNTEHIYLDVADGKLYRYDAENDVFVLNGDGSDVELGDTPNGLNLDADGKLNLALASGAGTRSIKVTGGEWDGLVFVNTGLEQVAISGVDYYLYRFSEDISGQGRSLPNAAVVCRNLIAEGASGVLINIMAGNRRYDMSTGEPIDEMTNAGTLSDYGIVSAMAGAMSVADKMKLDGLASYRMSIPAVIYDPSSVALDAPESRTYRVVEIVSHTSITLTSDAAAHAGVEHYLLFVGAPIADAAITPPSGAIASATSYTCKAGGALELSYIYARGNLIITGSNDLTTI